MAGSLGKGINARRRARAAGESGPGRQGRVGSRSKGRRQGPYAKKAYAESEAAKEAEVSSSRQSGKSILDRAGSAQQVSRNVAAGRSPSYRPPTRTTGAMKLPKKRLQTERSSSSTASSGGKKASGGGQDKFARMRARYAARGIQPIKSVRRPDGSYGAKLVDKFDPNSPTYKRLKASGAFNDPSISRKPLSRTVKLDRPLPSAGYRAAQNMNPRYGPQRLPESDFDLNRKRSARSAYADLWRRARDIGRT